MEYSEGKWIYGEDKEGQPVVVLHLGDSYRRIHPIIARVFGHTLKQAKANAHLIKAAPKMHEGLQRIREAAVATYGDEEQDLKERLQYIHTKATQAQADCIGA